MTANAPRPSMAAGRPPARVASRTGRDEDGLKTVGTKVIRRKQLFSADPRSLFCLKSDVPTRRMPQSSALTAANGRSGSESQSKNQQSQQRLRGIGQAANRSLKLMITGKKSGMAPGRLRHACGSARMQKKDIAIDRLTRKKVMLR